MNFVELLQSAKAGSEDAIMELLKLYDPMLMKAAVLNGVFDEDLYQELRMALRPSQILCKPPMWCRIEAPHRRFYI